MTNQQLLSQVREAMSSLNIDHLPTVAQLRSIGRNDLEREIYRLGGSIKFSEDNEIPLKKKVIKWSEDLILKELWKVVKGLDLKHYPTNKQMTEFTGSETLSNACNKRKTHHEWAKIMKLPLKDSDTNFGHEGEDILKSYLESLNYKCERLSTNCFYDFLVNDEVRVDCKISRLYNGLSGNFYSFNLERPNPDCDLFIFIILDEKGNKRYMVVPQHILKGQKQVSMGEMKSKWYEYENRFDFIDKYVDFYRNLK